MTILHTTNSRYYLIQSAPTWAPSHYLRWYGYYNYIRVCKYLCKLLHFWAIQLIVSRTHKRWLHWTAERRTCDLCEPWVCVCSNSCNVHVALSHLHTPRITLRPTLVRVWSVQEGQAQQCILRRQTLKHATGHSHNSRVQYILCGCHTNKEKHLPLPVYLSQTLSFGPSQKDWY